MAFCPWYNGEVPMSNISTSGIGNKEKSRCEIKLSSPKRYRKTMGGTLWLNVFTNSTANIAAQGFDNAEKSSEHLQRDQFFDGLTAADQTRFAIFE